MLVPIVLAAMDANKIRSVLAFDGLHLGFKVGAPLSVVTVWQFVSVPKSGVSVDTGVPLELLPFAAVSVPVALVVQSALTAGYFGSVADVVRGQEYDFVANVAAYFRPFFVLTLLPFLALLPLALGVVGPGLSGGVPAGALAVVALGIPVFVALAYLFYATPYLVVLRDVGVVDAARGSYALALRGGPYLSYFLGFALFVLAVSPVATVVVVNVPLLGVPLGVVGGGVLGLAANLATARFVADVDPESASTAWESVSPTTDEESTTDE
ncbi:hypothetical protein ACFQJD_14690 [Haloplanus sp. GCM10025708]|uniref:hypothetical protein n=1 Tax=Haloplanus sp. GCM10025708 TaxID=3252679 RepID=UPI00360DA083